METALADERALFDAVAAEYHAMRPAYPGTLFDDLATVVGGAGALVLEIGCGSGQATRGLLEQGWSVTAVDPGAELVGLARASLNGPVTFHVGPFETFDPGGAGYDLVASAQAWHWVDPAVGFAKAARALRPGGSLAVFGHVPMFPLPAELLSRLKPVYARHAPALWGPSPEMWYLPQGPVRALFDASELFGPVIHRGYDWSETTTAAELVRQLGTRSYYNVLPADQRARLFAGIEAALAPLGAFDLRHETHLYHAPLRS